MSNDPETTRYYLRATDPTTDEQIAFECVGLAVANAKAAELRMGRYKDVVMSPLPLALAGQPTAPPDRPSRYSEGAVTGLGNFRPIRAGARDDQNGGLMTQTVGRKRGRPSAYAPELADLICRR